MTLLSFIKDERVRLVQTSAVMMGFLALGMSQGIRGPTLLDLSHQVNVTVSRITYTMTARSIGHALGCLVSEYQILSADCSDE